MLPDDYRRDVFWTTGCSAEKSKGRLCVRSENLFSKIKIYENDETIGAYIAWIGSHQHESPINDMSSSFNMPGITLIVRKPLRANTRNALLQYSVAIGAASSEIFHIAEVELCW